MFGGTAAEAVLRGHIWAAGAVVTAAWVVGTWRGFRLVRLAKQGACPPSRQPKGPTGSQEVTFGPAGLDRSSVTMATDEKPGGRSDDVVERKLDMDVDRHGADDAADVGTDRPCAPALDS